MILLYLVLILILIRGSITSPFVYGLSYVARILGVMVLLFMAYHHGCDLKYWRVSDQVSYQEGKEVVPGTILLSLMKKNDSYYYCYQMKTSEGVDKLVGNLLLYCSDTNNIETLQEALALGKKLRKDLGLNDYEICVSAPGGLQKQLGKPDASYISNQVNP